MHAQSCFVTLTLAEMPADYSLNVKLWQDFAKRLRKACGRFRYFHAGEYGGKFGRPHYHAVLFGVNFPDRKVRFRNSHGQPVYESAELEELWGHGHVTLGDVEPASARYVAKYCTKKKTGDEAENAYTRIDGETGEVFEVQPEYATMSRRPGLGARWFEKFGSDVIRNDKVPLGDGRFAPVPRYYVKLATELEQAKLKVRRRLKRSTPFGMTVLGEGSEEPQREKARERCHEKSVARKRGSLD